MIKICSHTIFVSCCINCHRPNNMIKRVRRKKQNVFVLFYFGGKFVFPFDIHIGFSLCFRIIFIVVKPFKEDILTDTFFNIFWHPIRLSKCYNG